MSAPRRLGLASWMDGLFGVDARALAALRAGMALLILGDLWVRAGDLTAFHTDEGVLPRAALLAKGPDITRLSLHLAGGTAAFQVVMFLLAAFFAVLLLIGWRARLAAFVSWVLYASLSVRNPLVVQGGDTLLRMMLFWSVFLPLGAAWSADRALHVPGAAPPRRIVSMGSAALLLQIAMMYVFTAFLKDGAEWRVEHSAVYYALSIDQFVSPFGVWLRGHEDWLAPLTVATLWIEWFGPLLLLWPFRTQWVRSAAVGLFVAFHVVMGLSLRLGIFPFVDLVAMIPFLPSSFWDRLERWCGRPDGLQVYYDADCGFCKKSVYLLREALMLPKAELSAAQSDPAALARMQATRSWVVRDERGRDYGEFEAFLVMAEHSPWARFFAPLGHFAPVKAVGTSLYRWVASHRAQASRPTALLAFRAVRWCDPFALQALAGFFLGYVLLWNLGSLGSPFAYPRGSALAKAVYIDQWWSMFAPYPMKLDGWFVVPARLKDGTEVDLWSGASPVDWGKPSDLSGTFRNHRWTKYINNLGMGKYRKFLPEFADYLCRRWSAGHRVDPSKQIESFEVYFMAEPTLPGYRTEPAEKRLWLKHVCRAQKKHSNTLVSKGKKKAP